MLAIFVIIVKSSYKSEKDVFYNETVSQMITMLHLNIKEIDCNGKIQESKKNIKNAN